MIEHIERLYTTAISEWSTKIERGLVHPREDARYALQFAAEAMALLRLGGDAMYTAVRRAGDARYIERDIDPHGLAWEQWYRVMENYLYSSQHHWDRLE